jgi:hypothetical protein
MSSSGSGTVINYGSGSGSDFLTSYGSGSTTLVVLLLNALVFTYLSVADWGLFIFWPSGSVNCTDPVRDFSIYGTTTN